MQQRNQQNHVHTLNNENILDYALEAGANALEMDLNFDDRGYPSTFYHDNICDCLCTSPESCQFKVCNNARPAKAVLSHFMSHKKMGQVAMLYLDSKMGEMSETAMKQTGAHMVKFIEEELLSKGYKGIVLIGGAEDEYLQSLADSAKKSTFENQIFVAFDWHKDFKKGLKFIAGLDYPNKMISTGIMRCIKWAVGYEDEAVLGRINKARGVVSDIIIWTLDKEREFDNYYSYGARGIISNNIKRLVSWAKKRGHQLYTTQDTVCGATAGEENLVTKVGDCGCEKHGSGCRIDEEIAPVSGSACRCARQRIPWFGFIACRGDVVGCEDVTAHKCRNPDGGVLSCELGGGDCGGYN